MLSTAPEIAAFQVALWLAPSSGALAALQGSDYGAFTLRPCEGREQALALLAQGCDVLVVDDRTTQARELALEVGGDVAIVVVVDELHADRVLEWWRCGAQDVMLAQDLAAPGLARRLRGAIERKRLEREARTAYATDLDTGLPHQQQLIEHMSQLLALREREPAPMAVLALRIEGLASTHARLGRDAANALRRKLGVRLRAGVRASDVVASLGDDQFAVLLGSILTPADAPRVGAKLQKSLFAPFRVAGQDVVVASAIGIGQYPQDGTQPDALLRRAIGLASAAQALGLSAGLAPGEASAALRGAANDD